MANESYEVNQKIKEILNTTISGIVRMNWRVVWTYYKNSVEINRGTKDFTNTKHADELISLLRKKATLEDKGIIIDKIDLRQGFSPKKTKRYSKGYRRKW